MTTEYLSIIKKIDKFIHKHGIPYYIQKWKKPQIPEKFNSYEDFIEFLNKYTRSYHYHSHISSYSSYKKSSKKDIKPKERPMPKFKWDEKNKIGTIKFYHFYNGYNKKINESDTKKIIGLVHNNYLKWTKLGIKGLIIDFRKHLGGNMWPHIEALQDILGSTTLLSFNKIKTKLSDKKWINMTDGKIKSQEYFLSDKLLFNNPIAILVSQNTISSGEFLTSIFYGRDNVKIFGDNVNKTGGYLSVNDIIKINDDIDFVFTTLLCTTADGTFHDKEYLNVDKKTSTPITDAKKFINNY